VSALAGNGPLASSTEQALQPKETFQECDKCPEMVVVPAGGFTMGSPLGEKNRDDDEGPQQLVTMEKPFAVSKFHITVDQFAAFVSETNYDAGTRCYSFGFGRGKWEEEPKLSWRNPGFSQNGTHPVVCLNWNDAKAYVDWLAHKTDKGYRLLTEAEWEYAARAQTKPGAYPRYSFGDDDKDLCRYGNSADLTAKSSIAGLTWPVAPCNDGYAYTSPVGVFEANGFALYDMQGNAWQWTEDCYQASHAGSPSVVAAASSTICPDHVIRGGSWINLPWLLRAAVRHPSPTIGRFNIIGFRVARTLAP
jgi:formylglycine-generating enzyme required for sulfatase activity